MALVTLAEVQAYLGSSYNAAYDDFYNQQIALLSEAVEGYCGRKFESATYTQKWYKEDFEGRPVNQLFTFHYPLISVAYVKEKVIDPVQETTITTNVRIQKPLGLLHNYKYEFFTDGDYVEANYTAGFAVVPGPIKAVVLALIEERYNKKLSGVQLNFGRDVQSIAIPGTISVSFDYSLQSNQRSIAYGTILGSYVNVLDLYRSERRVIGSGSVTFVE